MRSGREEALLGDVSFTTALDSLPDPMVIVDEAGSIAAVNQRAEELLGYDRSELIGQAVEILVPAALRSGHKAHRAEYLDDPSARPMGGGLDLSVRCRDGTSIPVDISLSPLALDTGSLVLVALREMTAQRLVEEALAAFAFIVQSSEDAIYQVDPRGLILSWNPGAARMTGYTDADTLGKAPDFIFPEHRRADEVDVLQRALRGERVERRATELCRRYGLLVPVELTASPLRDRSGRIVGASVIAHDITEQRLAQDYLAQSQARLQEAQELANVGMWTWDLGSDLVQCSEPLYRILRLDPLAFDGSFAEFLGCVVADDRGRVAGALRLAADRGQPVALECGLREDADSSGWMSIRGDAVRDSAGTVVGLRGIVQDLTDRHLAENAIRDALAREREAAAQLRAADRLKDEFLSTVSHELRTPLTAIVGLSAVLVERPVLDDTAPDLIRRIQRNAEEMRGMIDRLLDFSRLEAGRVVLHRDDVPLSMVVQRAIALSEMSQAAHEVDLDIAPGLVVHADPDAIVRVLVNLLTNATKFSPPGSTVHVSAHGDGSEVIVSVRDEGNGLDPGTADRVFERFFQVEADQKAGRRGAGVGLSIVQRYVEMHGGRVWLDTRIGQGTTFSFALPAVGATA